MCLPGICPHGIRYADYSPLKVSLKRSPVNLSSKNNLKKKKPLVCKACEEERKFRTKRTYLRNINRLIRPIGNINTPRPDIYKLPPKLKSLNVKELISNLNNSKDENKDLLSSRYIEKYITDVSPKMEKEVNDNVIKVESIWSIFGVKEVEKQKGVVDLLKLLPNEILLQVLLFIPGEDLVENFMFASKRFNELVCCKFVKEKIQNEMETLYIQEEYKYHIYVLGNSLFLNGIKLDVFSNISPGDMKTFKSNFKRLNLEMMIYVPKEKNRLDWIRLKELTNEKPSYFMFFESVEDRKTYEKPVKKNEKKIRPVMRRRGFFYNPPRMDLEYLVDEYWKSGMNLQEGYIDLKEKTLVLKGIFKDKYRRRVPS